jgi:hypothetical protein
LKAHPNVRFVLCGHSLEDGVGRLTSEGTHGNRVHQLLANYQKQVVDRGESRALSGYLRIMRFSAQDTQVSVQTYSPWLDAALTDAEHRFTLDVDP